MTNISIFSFWFKCPYCDCATSVSQNLPLRYGQKVSCLICKKDVEMIGFIDEPQILAKETLQQTKVNKNESFY